QAPVFEGQSRKHPTAAARAGDADDFALEIRRTFDLRRRHDVADEFIDHTGDEYQIGSLGGGPQDGAGDGALMQLCFTGRESGHADGAAADMNEGQVEPVTSEETLVLRDIHGRFPFAE